MRHCRKKRGGTQGEGSYDRVIQFSGAVAVSLYPPPETGEGKGGGEGRWSAQTVLSPHPHLLPTGEGIEDLGRRRENRELHGPEP
jgi:hypothetical protein